MKRRAGAALVVTGIACAVAAFARPPVALAEPAKGTKPPAAPIAAPSPPPVPTSAMVHLADEITRGLGQVAPGALVAISPLVSDVPAPKGEELAIRLATHVAGRLAAAHAHPHAVNLAVARGASGRAASLVYVQLEIAKGEIRATADLYPVISNGWERLRNPAPAPRAHAFAGAPLDAEVRTFLHPIVLEQASVHKAKHEEADVLAIGCGDVDADGGLEIVLATRTRVVLGKLRDGKLAVVRASPWTQLASRAAVPMRDPLASVVIPRGRGELLVGSTDRAAIALDASLVVRRPLTGLPIPGADGTACTVASPESSAFEGSGIACLPPAKGDPVPVLPLPVPRFDAIAALDLVAMDGSISQVVATREPTGKLRLRRTDGAGKATEASVESAGAQLAVADLDLDGIPEIAFSADASDDTLTVASWRPNGLTQRLKVPAKDGIRAIAACPPEERGVPALALVVGSEVWLVR